MSFDIEINGQKIKLTNEDVEEIYRVQEREYRLCDARSAFQNRYEYDDTFEPIYGVTVEELAEDESFRNDIVDEFEDSLDCETPETTMWDNAVDNALFEKFCIPIKQRIVEACDDPNFSLAFDRPLDKLLSDYADISVVVSVASRVYEPGMDDKTLWITAVAEAFDDERRTPEAVFIEKDADTGVSVLDIEKLLAYFTSYEEDEDAEPELIPVTIEGDNSTAFGFVRYDVCDRLLDFRVENGTPFYNAVQKVLNDMSLETTFGMYDFENVLTKIIR